VYGLIFGSALLLRPLACSNDAEMLYGGVHDQQVVCRALRFDAMHARATG